MKTELNGTFELDEVDMRQAFAKFICDKLKMNQIIFHDMTFLIKDGLQKDVIGVVLKANNIPFENNHRRKGE